MAAVTGVVISLETSPSGSLVADLDEGVLACVGDAAVVGRGFAIAQGIDSSRRAADGCDFVDRRHRVARADLTRIDAVVVEVFALQGTGLVADEPVFSDPGRIELDLDLHILGNGEDG